MKKNKLKTTIFAVTLIFSGIIAVYAYGISADKTSESGNCLSNDNRVWHIENKYIPLELCERQAYNNSTYLFSSDSVSIINEYAGFPNQQGWDAVLANSFSNANSFHN